MRAPSVLLLLAVTSGAPSAAQSLPGAVPARQEPHHHLAYDDSSIVVLRVEVPAHDSTLLHEHAADYFWIGLGRAPIVNARLGSAAVSLLSEDRAIHYARGGFAHVALVPGAEPFRNITVELLGPQGAVRNRCEAALAGAPLDCPEAPSTLGSGAVARPALETDRLRVDLVTLGPGAALKGEAHASRSWVITLDPSDVRLLEARTSPGTASPGGDWRGGTWRTPEGAAWSLVNVSGREVTVLALASRKRE